MTEEEYNKIKNWIIAYKLLNPESGMQLIKEIDSLRTQLAAFQKGKEKVKIGEEYNINFGYYNGEKYYVTAQCVAIDYDTHNKPMALFIRIGKKTGPRREWITLPCDCEDILPADQKITPEPTQPTLSPTHRICPYCQGQMTYGAPVCPECQGTGIIKENTPTPFLNINSNIKIAHYCNTTKKYYPYPSVLCSNGCQGTSLDTSEIIERLNQIQSSPPPQTT